MKKKLIKIFIVMIFLFSLTGCVKYGKNGKKVITNEKTGQHLVTNIICKPTNKEMINLYKKYNKQSKKKVNIEKLNSCKNIKVDVTKDDIWNGVFVKPLAWLIINLGNIVKNYGLGLIIATLLIRLVAFPLTKKAALQSENLKKATPELQKLEKKYSNKNDRDSQLRKQQETLFIYKKYNVNPLSTCLFSIFQIPLFFAFYEAIMRIPVIFEEKLWGFDLGISPMNAVSKGDYKYLIFIVIISSATYFSFKLNAGASVNPEQQQQMKTMTNIMVIMMTIMAFSISTGIAFYWTTTNIFTIIQNLLVKRGKKNATNN